MVLDSSDLGHVRSAAFRAAGDGYGDGRRPLAVGRQRDIPGRHQRRALHGPVLDVGVARGLPCEPNSRKVANDLAARAWADRHLYKPNLTSIDEAIDQAVAVAADPKKSAIILADVADNPGGGGRGNTVYLLRRLHEAKVSSSA